MSRVNTVIEWIQYDEIVTLPDGRRYLAPRSIRRVVQPHEELTPWSENKFIMRVEITPEVRNEMAKLNLRLRGDDSSNPCSEHDR
jgi:hypothetical protein